MSDPQAAFAQALAAFQTELPHVGKGQTANIPKKTGGSYTYTYADLADITEVALPLLAKNGLAWSASPTVDGGTFVLRYALIHTEGHREGGDYPLPDPARFSSQEIGSALTYARRYALTAVTGIAPSGEDDDGAKASDARAADPLPRAPRTAGRTTGHNGDPTAADEWTSPPVDLGQLYRLASSKGVKAVDAFAGLFDGLHPKDATPEQIADFVAWLDEQEVAS